MPLSDHTVFVCPSCLGPLRVDGEYLACKTCPEAYFSPHGIPRFSPFEGEAAGLVGSTYERPDRYERLVAWKYRVQGLLGARDRLLGVRSWLDGRRVLDVGCGPAVDVPHVENHLDAVEGYVGVDYSPAFVDAARRRHPGEKFEFAQASVEALPFPDRSFDVVLLPFVLHHVQGSVERAWTEAVRVARERVIVYDHLRATGWRGRVQSAYWRRFDGGEQYLSASLWRALIAGERVERVLRTGLIFRHVIKFSVHLEPE